MCFSEEIHSGIFPNHRAGDEQINRANPYENRDYKTSGASPKFLVA